MAISWSGYEGHLRVGIDHVISPASPSHNDTTVDVTWKYYVDSDGWNFNDDQTLREDADGWAGTSDGFHNGSSGGAILVGTHTETYSISYSSGSKSASCSLSGAFNGATPSKSVTINLPDRPVAVPSAGESPVVSAITATGCHVFWNAPTDNGGASIDEYQIQVATGTGFASPVVNATFAGSGSASYDPSGLTPNTHYYVRVRAHNSAGWGGWTSPTYAPFTTLGATPAVPTGLKSVQRLQTSISVAWNAVSTLGGGAITYTLQLATNSTFTTGVVTYTGTSTSHQFTGLTANTTYYFRVKAGNSYGTSAYSGTLTKATLANPAYNDTGTFTDLLSNFAGAVADKLVHLGMFVHRGRTATLTFPNAAWYYIDMSGGAGTGSTYHNGPDIPTRISTADGDANCLQIKYEGTYEIEFAVHYPGGVTNCEQAILINGTSGGYPTSSTQKGGVTVPINAGSNEHGAYRVVTCTRRLNVNDTVGFGVFNGSGASFTTAGSSGDLTVWARLTLVGF